VSVVTIVGVRDGALFGNSARMLGSSPGPADPAETVIGLEPLHAPPWKNPRQVGWSMSSAGCVTLSCAV
jgi:hypothetical protein